MYEQEVERAFKRFKVWCVEREFPETSIDNFMYMGEEPKTGDYLFKNINTRNYIFIKKEEGK